MASFSGRKVLTVPYRHASALFDPAASPSPALARPPIANLLLVTHLGGWAVSLYGNPRATADIDFLISVESKNVEKILKVFETFGLRGVPKELFYEKDNVIRLGSPPTRIEILTSASGISFDDCYRNRKRVKLGDVAIKFISKEDLIKNKRAAGRPKDLADLSALE